MELKAIDKYETYQELKFDIQQLKYMEIKKESKYCMNDSLVEYTYCWENNLLMLNPQLWFKEMCYAARLGLIGNNPMTERQRKLLDCSFDVAAKGVSKSYYEQVDEELEKVTIGYLSYCYNASKKLGHILIEYALLFAYVDGEVDEQVDKELELLWNKLM